MMSVIPHHRSRWLTSCSPNQLETDGLLSRQQPAGSGRLLLYTASPALQARLIPRTSITASPESRTIVRLR